jgi:hypothetical protein
MAGDVTATAANASTIKATSRMTESSSQKPGFLFSRLSVGEHAGIRNGLPIEAYPWRRFDIPAASSEAAMSANERKSTNGSSFDGRNPRRLQ